MPTNNEHYETKRDALNALVDFMDRAVWDNYPKEKTEGSLAKGYYFFRWSDVVNHYHEYAEVVKCMDPKECERELAEENDYEL